MPLIGHLDPGVMTRVASVSGHHQQQSGEPHMAKKQSRSRGIRPVRNAWLCGLVMVASIALVLMGIADMRESGRSGSHYLTLGLIPALLSPIGFVYFLRTIPVVRAMRRGTTAIARWTISADEFRRFQQADARLEVETRTTNFYEPPRTVPADGVEVIFAADGVLIGDGYFPLSTVGGRRVTRVHAIRGDAPMIEFGTMLETRVRTSSASMQTVRTPETLRVPVATDAMSQANDVARRFDLAIARR